MLRIQWIALVLSAISATNGLDLEFPKMLKPVVEGGGKSQKLYGAKIPVFQFQRIVRGSLFLQATKLKSASTMMSKGTPACPDAYYQLYRGKCNKYEPGNPAKCPKGYYRDNVQRCTKSVDPKCPEGSTLSNGQCVQKGCPSNTDNVDGQCYEKCIRGMRRYQSNLCLTVDLRCPFNFNHHTDRLHCTYKKCPKNMDTTATQCIARCPTGFSRNNQYCVSSKVECPTNYKLDSKTNTCNLQSCSEGTVRLGDGCVDKEFKKCDSGFKEAGKNSCRRCKRPNSRATTDCYEWEWRCPFGWFLLSQEECTVICPGGTAALNGKCVTMGITICPEHFLYVRGRGCKKLDKCPSEFKLIGQECVPQPKTGCSNFTLDGKCVDNCPEGYTQHNHECVKVKSDKCPDQYSLLEGRYCVKQCPQGYTNENGVCQSSKKCAKSRFFSDGRCVRSCARGLTADKEQRLCKVNKEACKAKQVLFGTRCISEDKCISKSGTLDDHFRICRPSTACASGTYFFGQYCLTDCPVGYEAYARTCRKAGSTKCDKGVFYEGHCLEQCPAGFIPKLGSCVKHDVPQEFHYRCGVNMVAKECKKPNCTVRCQCKEGFLLKPGQNYCVPKSPKCASNHSLDIILIIDGSGYVKDAEFALMKLFLMEAVTHLYSAKTDIRIGVIVYGPAKPIIIYLNTIKRECDCIDYITNIQLVGSNDTNILLSLRIARELVLSQCNGARVGVAKQVYLVSMEKQFTASIKKALFKEAKKHQDAGYRLAFITVGTLTDLPPNVYNLNVDGFDKLSKYSSKLAEIACNDFICPNGYTRNKDKCVDVNECQLSPCHKSALCINTPGSFRCFCEPGLDYINKEKGCGNKSEECTDKKIDPKKVCDVIQCVGTANCSSSNGMGFCVCDKGYVYKAGVGCVDHNECVLNPCLDKAQCMNNRGGFKCVCPRGYTYNVHFGCVDVDECRTLKAPCKGAGRCINIVGGYDCVCQRGYEYITNVGCKDINECLKNPCTGANVQCNNTVGSFNCICPTGYEYRSGGCADIDECHTLGEKACGTGVLCKNTIGGYNCTCPSGFVFDQKTKKCNVDQSKGIEQKRGDLVFVVDSSEKIKDTVFSSVKSMVANIIGDYKDKSSTVITRISGLVSGGDGQTKEAFTNVTDKEGMEKAKEMVKMGGTTSIYKSLMKAHETYTRYGQVNSTKLVFLVSATPVPTNSRSEMTKIKSAVDKIKRNGRLIVIMIGSHHKSSDWETIFTKEEINKYVIIIAENMITTIHSLIHKKTDTLISCPEGFIFMDNVCQYKTEYTQYCKFDNELHAINSTWVSQCVYHTCTEKGVEIMETKCLGFDGDCYLQGSFFPCHLHGEYQEYCSCKIVGETKNIKGGTTGGLIQYLSRKKYGFEDLEVEGSTGKCAMPFKYKGNWYYSCTNDRASYPWCGMDHNYKSGRYLVCKEEKRPCAYNGTTHEHADIWEYGCNSIHCDRGSIRKTPRCRAVDDSCVAVGSLFSCRVNDKTYKQCMCANNKDNFGVSKPVDSTEVILKNHTSDVVAFCEQGTTKKRHQEGEEWSQQCYKLRCDKGQTSILEKKCQDSKEGCHEIGTSGFECIIKDSARSNCTCEEHKNNVVLVAYSEGKEVRQEVKSSSFISYRVVSSSLENKKKKLSIA